MSATERIVALVDMDCFYVQVEEREKPENKGKPACVVQYKNWKGGGIIAVNYEARACGVTKQMRGDEAKEKCPDILLYRIPELRGKADLTRYRDAGKEVIDVMCQFGVCVERASIDEAYLDMTNVINENSDHPESKSELHLSIPNTHVVGWDSDNAGGQSEGVKNWIQSIKKEHESLDDKDWKLFLGAVLVEKMRAAVFQQTGFRCSAGISHNKMLAKLACGINKPNKQTVMPMQSVENFFTTFPLKKVRHLGGKLGEALAEGFNCKTMGDIRNIPERILQQKFDEKTGNWLHMYSRGVDHEPVTSRRLPKSIGCSKNFRGPEALGTRDAVFKWLQDLCTEVSERLERDREMNKRTAKLLTLSVRHEGDRRVASYTRSLPLASYDSQRMATACMAVMAKENPSKQPNIWNPVVTCISVSASKFGNDTVASSGKIDHFFAKESAKTADSESDSDSLDDKEITADADANDLLDELVQQMDNDSENVESEAAQISLPVEMNEEPIKKKGFFANRCVEKKSLPAPAPAEEFDATELFPDLDRTDPDPEILALLPLAVQRRIKQEWQQKRGHVNYDQQVNCDRCNRQLHKDEFQEHTDYHLALDLQKELGAEQSTSSSVHHSAQVDAKLSKKNTKTSLKRTNKEPNRSDNKEKRCRTIDTFFQQKT